MTKRREPLTFHRALTTIAARIGWDRCGAICGVTERAVRNWSDPDTETEIRLLDALRLDAAFVAAGGERHPFHHCFGLRLELAAQEGRNADLIDAAGATAKESGEAVAALLAAASSSDPGVIRKARKEGEDLIAAATAAVAALPVMDGD